MQTYLINAVSSAVGLSQKRLRDYERLGFIKPKREAKTNNRLYTDADIRRIGAIKALIHEHGFTLKCFQYLLAAAPCWTIFQCEQRFTCPAYESVSRPCYIVKAEGEPSASEACSDCPVYLNRHTETPALLNHP
ncbi:MAG: MerR family transcriptional regulator [Desulfosarcinaceae bacterium]|nr:MerR family transcriptional regulator [Desulfosarcinaceae bacterium]